MSSPFTQAALQTVPSCLPHHLSQSRAVTETNRSSGRVEDEEQIVVKS